MQIHVTTVRKYTLLIIYIVVECSFKVIGGDFVYFWINAVVMNFFIEINRDEYWFSEVLVVFDFWQAW